MLNRLRSQIAFNVGALAVQSVLGLAAIPIGTQVLGPMQYGAYALALAFLQPVIGIVEAAASMSLSERWAKSAPPAKGRLVTSACVFAGAVLLVAGVPLLGLGLRFLDELGLLREAVLIAAAALPFAAVSAILRSMLILERLSWISSLSLLVQTAANLAVLALFLFVLDGVPVALFAAFLAGHAAGFAVLVAGTLLFVGWGRADMALVLATARNLPSTLSATALDYARGIVESNVTVRLFGLATLGLLSHARLYQGMLMQGTNTMASAVWPVALREAIQSPPTFVVVRRSWNLVYLGLGLVGIAFGCFGRDIIGLLTHGRFSDAAPMVSVLIANMFVQLSGRAVLASIYAHGNVRRAMYARSVSLAVSIAVLVAGPPHFGVNAVLAAVLIESVLYRLLLVGVARRSGDLPFLDGLALSGIALVLAATLVPWLAPTVTGTAAGAGLLVVLWLVVTRRTLADAWVLIASGGAGQLVAGRRG